METSERSKREMTFLLAGPERKVLRWLAERLPERVRPNHMTGIDPESVVKGDAEREQGRFGRAPAG